MSKYAKRTIEPRISTELTRIKEFKLKRFCSRHEIMEEIRFPETTPARIVIKSNEKGTGFMRNHYHDEYCKGYIDKKDFDATVDKVSLIIGNEYSRKRKLDTKGMDFCTNVLMLIALLQLILFFIFAMAFIETDGEGYKFVTIANAFIGFAIALSIMIYNYFKPYEESATFEQMVFRKVNEHLIGVNETIRIKKLEWVLIPNHYWMELRMLDKNEKDYDRNTGGEQIDQDSPDNNYLGLQNSDEDAGNNHSDENSKNFQDDEEEEDE